MKKSSLDLQFQWNTYFGFRLFCHTLEFWGKNIRTYLNPTNINVWCCNTGSACAEYDFTNMYSFHSLDTKTIVKIRSFCLRHYVPNSVSYFGKETWLTLCISVAKQWSSVKYLRWNKHQLFHRMTSVQTLLIYKNLWKAAFSLLWWNPEDLPV